jgi:Ala-tRNA(Pro) deacylase
MSLITEHLQRHHKAFEVLPHPPVLSSIDEARAIGIAAEDVIKTLVLDTAAGHALAVLPALGRLDLKLAQRAVQDHQAHLASEAEMSRDFPEFDLGAVPPLGSLLGGVPTFVDPDVMAHEAVVFAGSQSESVRIRTTALFDDESIRVVPLSRHPDYDDF